MCQKVYNSKIVGELLKGRDFLSIISPPNCQRKLPETIYSDAGSYNLEEVKLVLDIVGKHPKVIPR